MSFTDTVNVCVAGGMVGAGPNQGGPQAPGGPGNKQGIRLTNITKQQVMSSMNQMPYSTIGRPPNPQSQGVFTTASQPGVSVQT